MGKNLGYEESEIFECRDLKSLNSQSKILAQVMCLLRIEISLSTQIIPSVCKIFQGHIPTWWCKS